MTGAVIVDSNLLALLVIGGTSRSYIGLHKRTRDEFDVDDFDLLSLLIKDFSEIVLVAHVVAETSNLVRQIGDPKRGEIQRVFARFVAGSYEIPVASVEGLACDRYGHFGVTDGVLLYLCGLPIGETRPTLLTVDGPLTDHAQASGLRVINYKRAFKS